MYQHSQSKEADLKATFQQFFIIEDFGTKISRQFVLFMTI
jgi:hypothetical protein